jgi:hypothetical protein
MPHRAPGVDMGSSADVDEVKNWSLFPSTSDSNADSEFNYLLRLVRSLSLTQYLSSHPTAYNELIAAVQDIPPPKALPSCGLYPAQSRLN